MAWGRAGTKTSENLDTEIEVSSIPDSESGLILFSHIFPSDATASNKDVTFNDSTSGYYDRYNYNNASSDTATSHTGAIRGDDDGTAWDEGFMVMFLANDSGSNKLCIWDYVGQTTSAGGVPSHTQGVGKWENTAVVNKVKVDGKQGYNAGGFSNMTILGDGTPTSSISGINEMDSITNIPANTIFEYEITGEHHLRAKYGWFKFGDSGSIPNYRGIFTGGDDSNNPIDYITIATLGNSADFGDGGSTGKMGAAVGNGTLGIYGGDDNVLNQVTIATTANSTDFGDLTGIGGNATACADATRGVWTRGNINYITMASASNATDWGHDRSPNAGDPCAFADTTRGIVAGGETNEGGWHDINDMDYITIQTISSTTDFGDMTDVKRQLSGVANDTYGFTMCGYNGSSFLSTIDYVTIQTLGNASSFGNLTQARTAQNSACGDSTRAVLGGGHTGSSSVNTIDYFTMGTSGSSSDFGDLTSARTRVMSCSDYVK